MFDALSLANTPRRLLSCPFTATINIRKNLATWEMAYTAKVIVCVLQHTFLQNLFQDTDRLTIIHVGHWWPKAKKTTNCEDTPLL